MGLLNQLAIENSGKPKNTSGVINEVKQTYAANKRFVSQYYFSKYFQINGLAWAALLTAILKTSAVYLQNKER